MRKIKLKMCHLWVGIFGRAKKEDAFADLYF